MRLIVVRGPVAVEPLVLGDSVAVVGRDDTADLVLPSKRVSRRHCEVRAEGGGVRFTDLGSQNMLVDPSGRKLREAVFVPGERVQVGDFLLEVDGGLEPRERTETLELDPDDVPDDLVLEDDFLETDETSSKGLVETFNVSPTSSAILPMRAGPLKVSQRKPGANRLVDPPADVDGPTPKAARPPPFVPPVAGASPPRSATPATPIFVAPKPATPAFVPPPPPGTLRPLVPQTPAVHGAARVAPPGVTRPVPPPQGPRSLTPKAPFPAAPSAARPDGAGPDPLARARAPARPAPEVGLAPTSGDLLARGAEPRRRDVEPATTPSPTPRPVRYDSLPTTGPAPRGAGVPLVIQGLFVAFLTVGLILFAPFGGQFALVRASADGWEAAGVARGEMAASTLAVRNSASLALNDKAQLDSCCFASWEGVRTVAITDAAGTVLAPPERAGTSLAGGDLLARARKERVPVSMRNGADLEIVAPAVQNGNVVGFAWVTFDPNAGMPATSSTWARAFAALIVAMMGAMVLVVGGWFTLLRPMSALADNAESLAHGEASLLLPSARFHAIERLAHAVNRAVLRMRRSEGGEA